MGHHSFRRYPPRKEKRYSDKQPIRCAHNTPIDRGYFYNFLQNSTTHHLPSFLSVACASSLAQTPVHFPMILTERPLPTERTALPSLLITQRPDTLILVQHRCGHLHSPPPDAPDGESGSTLCTGAPQCRGDPLHSAHNIIEGPSPPNLSHIAGMIPYYYSSSHPFFSVANKNFHKGPWWAHHSTAAAAFT